MIELICLIILAGAIVCAVATVRSRSLKLLEKTQIILVLLPLIVGSVDMEIGQWLHSMAYNDPVRRLWESRLNVMIGNIPWFGSIILLIGFTIFHVIFMITRALRGKDGI